MSFFISKHAKIVNHGAVNYGDQETQITIERSDGMRFTVNIPEECWTEDEAPTPHGLNLVFGCGRHYE